MGKLTHLEAFTSDDAKRGRVWTDGHDEYKRSEDRLYQKYYRNSPSSFWWEGTNKQVAAMEGIVTWADEPKTLTTQEAARALADGKCISADLTVRESSVIKLGELGIVCWTRDHHEDIGYRGDWFWDVASVGLLGGYYFIVPDPSPIPPLPEGER